MMEHLTSSNKNHLPNPCHSWVGQNDNGWSTNPTTSTQAPTLVNSLPSSQQVFLGSTSNQRASYDQLQVPNPIHCTMNDISAVRNISSANAMYKNSHINKNGSNLSSSVPLFNHTTIQTNQPHIITFPHNSSTMLQNANQGVNLAQQSIPQTNRTALQSHNNPYKVSFEPRLNSQGLSNGLQSYAQSGSASQATFEGANVAFACVSGYTHNHHDASSASQALHNQWITLSHCTAVNESVPDSAAHPNKAPQERSTSTTVTREERRSILLQQRAQLLEQLSKLDKFLEQFPPDESLFPNTSTSHTTPSINILSQCQQNTTGDEEQIQPSVSHSSPDCSPPASPGVHSETCDSPEVQMSDGESMKKETLSDMSERDCDPDYLPQTDNDSDIQSGNKRHFPDESSPSGPSTSKKDKQKPSLKRKRRTVSESPLSEEESDTPPPPPPPKKTQTATEQKRSDVVVPAAPKSMDKVGRASYCLFCGKQNRKLPRHLEQFHSDQPEVAVAFQYPKNSTERKTIWKRLRNRGDFAHNKYVLGVGKGELAVRRRLNQSGEPKDFLPCLHCQGLYRKKDLHKHVLHCSEKVKSESTENVRNQGVLLRCAVQAMEVELGVTDGFKEILLNMSYNDVSEALIRDKVILQYGDLMYKQFRSDKKSYDRLRQNLRQTARLLLEAQKTTPLKKMEDFFLPSNFLHVVTAVNVVAGYDPSSKSYSIPSLAIKLGYNLQKTCDIVKENAEKSGDKHMVESTEKFMSLYQKKWNKLISRSALTTLRKTKLRTKGKVPLSQDVKRLNFHMEKVHLDVEKKLKENPTSSNYTALARVMLCRTAFFNRRTMTEISDVPLKAFENRTRSKLMVGLSANISDLERTMCQFFTRIDIRGKCGRLYPILLKPSFVSALELLVELRETCGISKRNTLLFARPYTVTPYKGSVCLQEHANACGAKDPETLKPLEIRKHYATMLQLINLDDDEAEQILGPNNEVRTLKHDEDMKLDDVEMGRDRNSQAEREQQAASLDPSENYFARRGTNKSSHQHGTSNSVHQKSVASAKKGPQQINGKRGWEESEVLAVERHLMGLIKEHKVPQKEDCIQCLEAEPEALSTRTWRGLKDYVRNRITALKRERGTAKVISKNTNGH